MILRKETETVYGNVPKYLPIINIRMNDTPQGDGNFANVHIMNNMFKFLYKNE